jgi:hypothetical protein
LPNLGVNGLVVTALETMAIVSKAVTTSPFTPRFGKPTFS